MSDTNRSLNGLINPKNNNLTDKEELKRLNVVLKGLIIYTLESISEQQKKSFEEVVKELKNAINKQLEKEGAEFKNLFK